MAPFHGEQEMGGLAALHLDLGKMQEEGKAERPAPALPAGQERQLYRLVLVDESTGVPVRAATEEDLSAVPLNSLEPPAPASTHSTEQPAAPTAKSPNKQHSLQELLAEARNGKGPVCDHCGATGGLVGIGLLGRGGRLLGWAAR